MKKNKQPFEISEEKVIEHIEREYQLWYAVAKEKREIFRDQDEMLNNTSNLDKIDMKTLFYIIENLLALYYTDELKIEFSNRKYNAKEQAKNLNKLASFDYQEMKKDIMDYEIQMNRFVRWVGIVAQIGWDEYRSVPLRQVIDTRSWIPDPMGWFDPDKFRFYWFEWVITKDELKNNPQYNQEQVEKLVAWEWYEERKTRERVNTASNVNFKSDDLEWDNKIFDIYHHFTTFEWKKYVFTLWDERKTLLRAEEIKPTCEEEKKNPSLISFPVSLFYFSPQKFKPFWNSIVDLLQDKHRYKNILANLAFIREKDAALWDDVLFDTNLIKSSDITRPTMGKKFIPVDWRRGNMGAAMMAIPKNPTPSSTYTFEQFLDRNIEMTVGIDARQIWVAWDRSITATEAQMLQANNNLKAIFKNRINNVWEKKFWELWYKSYRKNFSTAKKKIIRISDSFWWQNIEFTKKDFITSEDPDIVIKSKTEVKAEREWKKRDLMPLLMNKTQDPNAPVVSRKIAERKLYELNWMSDEEIEAICPYTYEELDAMQKLELINMGLPEWAEIDNANVDHQTYITIFQRAIDNDIKFAAIEARKQMIIDLWLNQQQTGWNQMTNQLESQMVNQAQNQTQNLNVESRWSAI